MDAILESIRNGKRVFKARFANQDNADGSAPEWSDYREVTLFVQLRAKAFKKHPVGEILCLTPENVSWAEYSEKSYCGHGHFMAENYRMELLNAEAMPIVQHSHGQEDPMSSLHSS